MVAASQPPDHIHIARLLLYSAIQETPKQLDTYTEHTIKTNRL